MFSFMHRVILFKKVLKMLSKTFCVSELIAVISKIFYEIPNWLQVFMCHDDKIFCLGDPYRDIRARHITVLFLELLRIN